MALLDKLPRLAQLGMTSLLIALAGCGSLEDAQMAQFEGELVGGRERLQAGLTLSSQQLSWSSHTNLCLGVLHNSAANGTPVHLQTCSEGAGQKWTFVGGQLKTLGNKCLDVTGGTVRNGTKLQIWDCTDGDTNQQWVASGSSLQWKAHTLCVDVTGGTAKPGTPLQVWACDGKNTNQAFAAKGASSTPTPPANTGSSGTTPVAGSKTHAPRGLDVAPYFVTWAQWGDYLLTKPQQALSKAGAKSITVAFGIAASSSGCKLSSDLSGVLSDTKAYATSGGRVILSFGGASGTYIQQACSNASTIASLLEGQMNQVGQHNLDFDIENGSLSDRNINGRLIDALVILQKKYSDLYVSYTLPVDYRGGLGSNSLQLIKDTVAKGVLISRVNIMTMDFGTDQGTSNMATMTTTATDVTHKQLAAIYPSYSSADIFHLIGITPMIGENDDHLKFTIANAQTVADYAKKNGVGMLSFWNIQRDRAASGSLDDFSNVSQSNYQFLKIFQSAQ